MADKPIQLYSLDTPNGQKIGTFLEEAGIPYEAHVINIMKGDQFKEEFLKISPNNKIPAIVDPNGPDGKPIAIMESGAILLYLAEKSGKFLAKEGPARYEAIQWLMWQMGGLGPMFGQYGHFSKYAPEKLEYAINRYLKEAERLLKVLEKQLEGHDWVVGNELTVADFAIAPWLKCLDFYYKAPITWTDYPNVDAYLKRFLARPAVQKGMNATPMPSSS